MLDIDTAIDQARATPGTVVLADTGDNAAGGAPSDCTYLLRRLFERGIGDACVGPVWDAGAVQLAFVAGAGASLPLRIGGKIGPLPGALLDRRWTVLTLKGDMAMTGLASILAKLGDCALIASASVRVVITGIRYQAGARSGAVHELAGCGMTTETFWSYFLQAIHGLMPLTGSYMRCAMASNSTVASVQRGTPRHQSLSRRRQPRIDLDWLDIVVEWRLQLELLDHTRLEYQAVCGATVLEITQLVALVHMLPGQRHDIA